MHEEPAQVPEEQPNENTEENTEENGENVIQGMFSDNEEILKFFEDGVTENTETEID